VKDANRALRFAVPMTHMDEESASLNEIHTRAKASWSSADWPLLLILIHTKPSAEYSSGREFTEMTMSKITGSGEPVLLWMAGALRWQVEGTRWSIMGPQSEHLPRNRTDPVSR
jgi:hypothetical protein